MGNRTLKRFRIVPRRIINLLSNKYAHPKGWKGRTGERKKWARQFYLTWKVLFMRPKNCTTSKVINYETIAKDREAAWDCVCLSSQREWERVPYVTLRIDFGSLLTIPSSLIVSSNDFSFFSVFLIIPFIFPHFTDSSVHHASSLLGQLDDLNWYMLFYHPFHEKWHTHTQLPYRFHFDPACFQHCAVRNASNDTNIFAIEIEWNCSTFHSDDFFMLKQCP